MKSFLLYSPLMTERRSNSLFEHPVIHDAWRRTKATVFGRPIHKLFPDIEECLVRTSQLIDEQARSPCLEVGGGRGEGSFTLVGKGLNVVTLEKSKSQCALLRRRYPDLVVVRGDANRLPFKDQTFWTTNYREVIHHLKDPLQAMLEARRVSRESVITDVIADNRRLVRWLQKIWLLVQDDRARLLDEREWKSLLKTAGAFESTFVYGASIQYFLFAHVDWTAPAKKG